MNNLKKATLQEKINFIKFIYKNKAMALRAVIFVFKKIFWKLRQVSRVSCYPDYIKTAIRDKKKAQNTERASLGHRKAAADLQICKADNTIELLYSRADFNDLKNYILNTSDEEESFIFYRFNWLLNKLSEFPGLSQEWGLVKVKQCLEKGGCSKNKFYSNAYNASERINNLLIFYMLTSDCEKLALPGWLENFITNSAVYISKELEFYPQGRVNNHIINDARGLYFAGVFLGSKCYIKTAVSILKNELPRIITEDGFLREGSSHYHFLITRWLLEIIFLAELISDTNTKSIIQNFAEGCVRSCWFFLVQDTKTGRWDIPLIGDISPDFSPQWLSGLPWSNLALSLHRPQKIPKNNFIGGWGSLFGFNNDFDIELTNEKYFQYHSNSGWYRLDFHRFTIFWHVAPGGPSLKTTHGHSDTGSFCLYLDGYPILADIGRYNYTDSAVGTYGISAAAHNSIMIDGLEPFAPANYPNFYISSHCHTGYKDEGEKFIFKILHNGFNRIFDDKINLQREFIVEKDKLQIIDNLEGGRRHNIEQSFHFYPGIKIEKEEISGSLFYCKHKDLHLNFKVIDFDKPNGFIKDEPDLYFPAYAKQVNSSTIRISQRQRLPFSQRFVLEISSGLNL